MKTEYLQRERANYKRRFDHQVVFINSPLFSSSYLLLDPFHRYFVTPTKHTHTSSHDYTDSFCSTVSDQSSCNNDEEVGGVDLEPSDVEKPNESLQHPSEEVGGVNLEPCDAEKTGEDLQYLGERLSTHLNRNCRMHFL